MRTHYYLQNSIPNNPDGEPIEPVIPEPSIPTPEPDPYPVTDPVPDPKPDPAPHPEPTPVPGPPEPIPQFPPDVIF